ncbi:MAG: hypothetical protein HWN66_13625 [Candidatus Helarchaeota archaeon]|nr:hypothetical protein [Candidatus Helarchaeota archaeon]
MEEIKQEFKQILKKMEKFDKEYKKKLLFLGLINKYLKKMKSGIIILGGFAVQFYLAGEYLTRDVDLACDNKDALNDLLFALNFEKIGRHYFLDELDLAIEIPSSSISRNQQGRLFTIDIEGYEIQMLGIEDIVIDRVNAFTHWQSLEDGRLAKELLFIHFEQIDWNYLETRARDEHTDSELQKMKEEIIKQREENED